MAPHTIPPKAPPAKAVLMTLSPTKGTNPCRKENCRIHVAVAKVDESELEEIMGRISLYDVTNKKDRSIAGPSGSGSGVRVAIPRPLYTSYGRRPKVKFHFVRHAQAIHNMRGITGAQNLRDTTLTPHGMKQAESLSLPGFFPSSPPIKIILSSPLRRTINTALLGFSSIAAANGVEIILWSDLREYGISMCNTGSSLLKLRENIKAIEGGAERKGVQQGKRAIGMEIESEMEDAEGKGKEKEVQNEDYTGKVVINTSLLYGGWEWNFEMTTMEKVERIERVKTKLKELEQVAIDGGVWHGIKFEKSEKDVGIVIVSHGGFLRWLMGHGTRRWANAEYRTFKFPSIAKIEAGHPPLEFIETKASVAKTHYPIRETGQPFWMEIDETTKERLAEVREYLERVELVERRANNRAKAFKKYKGWRDYALDEESGEADESEEAAEANGSK
ncbi:hypothetical protein VTL71DRAFT_12112 [Oculimacula yallundae]|uniref:Phosphoglycerate mutase-like protein n=1 Tax=Oculimacula yallundae TaxID=86028 RepID=A0ABR4CUL2_9HELO